MNGKQHSLQTKAYLNQESCSLASRTPPPRFKLYMDDILVHTMSDITAHREKFHRVLQKLRQHDLYLKPEKCQFEQKKVELLGITLEKETVQMDPTKTKGIADWKTPQNLKDVCTFLGFTGFY